MTELEGVSVVDWLKVIKEFADCIEGAVDPAAGESELKIDRLQAFDGVQALLRGGIFAANDPIGKLHRKSLQKLKAITLPNPITEFLNTTRSANFKSIGIHIVDPIEGRISTIWTKPDQDGVVIDEPMLAKCELYSRAWNRIYRRLFRPSATLINAIESGVLPWQWDTVRLSAEVDADSSSLDSFFKDTTALAKKLFGYIKNEDFLPNNPDAEEPRHIEAVFQKTWIELENCAFTTQLKRIAERFRDSILDNEDNKKAFAKYLKLRGANREVPPVIKSASSDNPTSWSALLDAIEGIQSSILSQPEFCDTTGLWLHRIDFDNAPLKNRTSIYFIFGLTDKSDPLNTEFIKPVTESFGNLGKALNELLYVPNADLSKSSDMSKKLFEKIKNEFKPPIKYGDGLRRWLFAVEKIAREAKHEGFPINYNMGYGSLAYAQSHLHRYEVAPIELSKHNAPIDKIASYVKGFYSIFGNRDDRGLWFDEIGQYRGVFESQDGLFEKAACDRATNSQHQNTILFAKIKGSGIFDILHRNGNQIARIKNGEIIDMVEGDKKRRSAIELLTKRFADKHKAFDNEFILVTKWLVDELVEVLQAETHGTSFVISFEANGLSLMIPRNKGKNSWRSSIKSQVKTLVGDFSQLEAPLATWEQLKNGAESKQKSNYKRPAHPFNFLAELANLDGGLWLRLSNQGENNGLTVRAAQQFIPLLKIKGNVQPLDLHMDLSLFGNASTNPSELPRSITHPVEQFCEMKALFGAINTHISTTDAANENTRKYIDGLSFLHHSGTKTHSLWGLSLTALELCICVVLSTDGNIYVFNDGREFTQGF